MSSLEDLFADPKIYGYWYVITGHFAGENFAHTEMYQPHEKEKAEKQARRWKQEVGYDTVKMAKFGSKEEAIIRMYQIEHLGW